MQLTRSQRSWFFFSLALGSPIVEAQAAEKRYAIMDNDWGAVGFLPFLMALKNDFEVLALTSDTANSWQHQCAYHALANLEVSNLTCISVYAGATWPLINTPDCFQAWEAIHGKLPWQGAFAPYNKTAEDNGNDPTSGDDPERIVPSAFIEGFPKTQVSIYSAGSLTNVTLAVRMDSSFASLAKELVIMGGYVDVNMFQVTGDFLQADTNSDPQINLMIDPEASKIALNANFPNIIVAGNVANQVQSTQEFLDEVIEVVNPWTQLFHDHSGTEFSFWDETAAALMIDPAIAVNTTTAYIDVDVAYASPSYGNIHVYQADFMPTGLRNVTYVNEIDGDAFKRMMKEAMQDPPTCP